SIWNVSGSVSTKTGSAWCSSTALMVATKVYGGTSTSSPGPMSSAAIAVTSAEVPLAVARQYFEPSRLAQASSNCATYVPPVRFHRPLRSTSPQLFSSLSLIWGHEGKRRSRTGAPPSSAGLSIGLAPAASAVAEAAVRKVLRVFVLLMVYGAHPI